MVDVSGEDEVISPFENVQEVKVGFAGSCLIAVEQDGAAPPRPVGLQVRKGMEAARVHVGYPEAITEVCEVLVKALAGIGEACRSGEPGACTH